MKQDTCKKLIKLNEEFYRSVGSKMWNSDPNYYWDGWKVLNKELEKFDFYKKGEGLEVLDVGCGYARFLNYLESLNKDVKEFVGVDISKDMLDGAGEICSRSKAKKSFIQADLIHEDWVSKVGDKKFHLAVAFGLFHHIPSFANRIKLIKEIVSLLDKDGIFVFTTWRFNKMPRLIRRMVDLDSEEGQTILHKIDVDKAELESGDSILNWVKKEISYRYSHSFDVTEIDRIMQECNLELVAHFLEDDRTQDRNGYYVCKIKN